MLKTLLTLVVLMGLSAPPAPAQQTSPLQNFEPVRLRMQKDNRLSMSEESFNGEKTIHIYLSLSDQPTPYLFTLGWFVAIEGKKEGIKVLDEFGERIPLPYFKPERKNFNKADLLSIQSFDLISDGKMKEAAQLIEQGLKEAPQSAKLHNNFGVILALRNQYVNALKEFQTALKLKQDYAGALSNMAWLDIAMAQPALAERDGLKALSIDGKLNPARLAVARAKLNSASRKEAAKVAAEVKGAGTRDLASIETLADAQMAKGDYKAARQSLRKLIFINSSNHSYLLKLAQAAALDGDLDEGISRARQAVQIAPGDPASHLLLGQYLEQNRDQRAALLQYQLAADLYGKATDPEEARLKYDVYGPILRIVLSTRSLAEADRLSRQWVKDNKDSHQCHFNRAWIASKLEGDDKLKEAIAEYQKALALNSELSSARYNLALLFLKQGREIDGAEELKRFIKQAPDDPDSKQARALLAEIDNARAGRSIQK